MKGKPSIITALSTAAGTIGVLSLVIFIPAVRNIIIDFGERYVGRPLTRGVWHRRFMLWEIELLFWCAMLFFPPRLLRSVTFAKENISILAPRPPPHILSKKFLTAIILSFTIIAGVRIYWMTQKAGFHMDELWGIALINYNDYKEAYGYSMCNEPYLEPRRAYTGLEIKENAFFDNASPIDAALDVARLWKDNRDSPHTSLYYMLERLWFTGVRTHSFKYIFIRGSLLNLAFFCISFYMMLRLLMILTQNKATIIALLFAAFCNPASTGLSIFLRSYAMQETALITFSYLLARYLQLLRDGISLYPKKLFIQSIAVTAFVLSSDYFPVLYVAVAGLLLLIMLCHKKACGAIPYFTALVMLAFVAAKCAYLDWGRGFFKYRGEEAFAKLGATQIGQNLSTGIQVSTRLISQNLIPFFLLALLFLLNCAYFVLMRKQDNRRVSAAVILPLLAFAWCFLGMFFAPFKTLRYIAPVFGLLPLCLIPSATIRGRIFPRGVLVIQIAFAVFVTSRTIPLAANARRIEHIDDRGRCAFPEYNKHPNIPVFIKRDCSFRMDIFPYLDDEQIYYGVNTREEAEEYGFKEYFYVESLPPDGFSESYGNTE